MPVVRPRRLRSTPVMRSMIAETTVQPRQLILPLFVAEGATEPRSISSMPGVVQHTLDSLRKAVVEAAEAGLAGVMLFGIPERQGRPGLRRAGRQRDSHRRGADGPRGGRRQRSGDDRRLP